MILVTPLWPQKEWYPDHLLKEPLKLLMLWNLLVQPHIKKFNSDLESLHLHVWKLSSDSSTRQAFQTKLRNVSQQKSGNPQHVFTREGGQSSSIDDNERGASKTC